MNKAELEQRLDEWRSKYWSLERENKSLLEKLDQERGKRESDKRDADRLRRDLALAEGWINCKLDLMPGGHKPDEITPESHSREPALYVDEPWKL